MYLFIYPQTNPVLTKDTGQILIKLIAFLSTFLLIGGNHLEIDERKTYYSSDVFLNKIKTILALDCSLKNK